MVKYIVRNYYFQVHGGEIMKLKPTLKIQIIICSIFFIAISAFVFLLVYKPSGITATAPEAPAADAGQVSPGTADENENPPAEAEAAADEEQHASDAVREINIHVGFDSDNTLNAIDEYAKRNWNFKYKLNTYTGGNALSSFDVVSMIQTSLASGDGAVDIYRVPASYATYFIKGEYSRYACTYKELGIDVETALKKADIPDYIVESGCNPDGELIALPYLAETNVFLYKRSVAKDVWGTDDPDTICGIIGGGTQKWDKLIEAARTLKENGYYIAPDFTDFSYMIRSMTPPAGKDQEFDTDPLWEKYMDVSKLLFDSGCIKNTRYWSPEWFDDLNGKGDRIFGTVTGAHYLEFILDGTSDDWAICLPPFSVRMDYNTGILVSKDSPNKDLLGPLVEWMTLDCSKEGLQYGLASGTLFLDKKMPVVSRTVLKSADTSIEILGGQSAGSVILEAMKRPMEVRRLDNVDLSATMWEDSIRAYLNGESDKEAAISKFKSELRKNGIMSLYTGSALTEQGSSRGEPVVFKDRNFELTVRKAIFKPESDIYASDLDQVTSLSLGEEVTDLEDLVHFKNLESLYIRSGKLTDISFLKDFTGLKVLYIPYGDISDISVLGKLTKLEQLNLDGNKVSDISCLKELTNLEYLSMSNNEISDISVLGNLSGLKTLVLSNNDIKDISCLRSLKHLESLSLAHNKIRDISSLGGLKNLREVYLSGNDIADSSPVDHVNFAIY